MQSNAHSHFLRELRAFIQAPYAYLDIQTFEESRAIALISDVAKALDKEVKTWSPITGFEGSPSNGDFEQALRIIESSPMTHVFVLKDCESYLEDEGTVRRLREMEAPAAAFGKTVIFLGSELALAPKLEKDITRLYLPLPDRDTITREFIHVFGDAANDEAQLMITGAMGLTVKEAHRAFHRVKIQQEEADRRNAPFDIERAILREKQQLVAASDVLEFHPLEMGLDDVGGLNEMKRWLAERQDAFSEDAQQYGLPTPKGVLLIGVQGCGKSLTAKVVGRHWGLPLLRLDLGAVFDGNKTPEEAMRHALAMCDAIAPCVLWMDEIEKGFDASDGRTSRVLGSLLTWQQEKLTPVFLVATANDVSRLPPELLRKGRFDEIFFVDLPDVHERKAILEIHLLKRSRMLPPEVVEELAQKSEYFSGAELEQIVVSGLYTSFAERRELTREDLLYALDETVPLYRTYEEGIKGLREWAEGRARRASTKRRVLDFFEKNG